MAVPILCDEQSGSEERKPKTPYEQACHVAGITPGSFLRKTQPTKSLLQGAEYINAANTDITRWNFKELK